MSLLSSDLGSLRRSAFPSVAENSCSIWFNQSYAVLQREGEASQGTGAAKAVLLGTDLTWPQRCALLRFLKTNLLLGEGLSRGPVLGWGWQGDLSWQSSFDLVTVEPETTDLGVLGLSARLCPPSAISTGITQGQTLDVVLDAAATVPSQLCMRSHICNDHKSRIHCTLWKENRND